MKKCVTCLVLSLIVTTANGAGIPFAVVTDGRYSQGYKDYLKSVATNFDLVDELHPSTTEFLDSQSSVYPSIKLPAGGVAHLVVPEKSWQIQTCLFYRVPNEDDGEKWVARFAQAEVARRLENRGIKSEVVLSGANTRVTSKETVKKGKVTIRYNDYYLAYRNGVVAVSSHPEVFQYKLDSLARMTMKSWGKSSYFSVNVASVPSEYRNLLVGHLSAHVRVGLQRRDGEDLASYELRRAFGTNLLELVSALGSELNSIVGWTQLPTDRKPFESHLEIAAKPKGVIDSFFHQLAKYRSRNPIEEKSIASGRIAFAIPDQFQVIFSSWLNAKDPPVPFHGLMMNAIERGSVDLNIAAGFEGPSRPLVSGFVRTNGQSGEISESGPFPDGMTVESTSVHSVVQRVFSEELRTPLHVRFTRTPGRLNFSLDDVDNASVANPDTKRNSVALPRGVIATLHLDLNRLPEHSTESKNRRFITVLEQVYDWYIRERLEAEALFGRSVGTFDPENFQSFCDRVTRGDTWSGRSSVRVKDSKLIWSTTIGSDLFAFIEARKLAAGTRFRVD